MEPHGTAYVTASGKLDACARACAHMYIYIYVYIYIYIWVMYVLCIYGLCQNWVIGLRSLVGGYDSRYTFSLSVYIYM